MTDEETDGPTYTQIGRRGSPQVTIAFPFSNVVSTDTSLRDSVVELAALLGRLAAATGTEEAAGEAEAVRASADELVKRLQAT